MSLALRSLRRLPIRTLAATTPNVSRFSSNIAGGSMGKAWADKEHAAENQYFNKKDAEILAQLAAKLHNHTAPNEQSIKAEKEQLTALFEKHSLTPSDALLDDIIKFKFNH